MSGTAAVWNKCKVGQTKVKRYWPGKVPDGDADDNVVGGGNILTSRDFTIDKIKVNQDDPRLRRLAELRNRQEVQQIRQAEIVSSYSEDDSPEKNDNNDDDDPSIDETRMRIKEKTRLNPNLYKDKDEYEEESDDDEEESEEEESVEEEEQGVAVVVVRLEYNHKQRFTTDERKKMKEKEINLKKYDERRKEEMRAEFKEHLVEIIRQDESIHLNRQRFSDDEINTDDDDDDDNVSQKKKEYESWVSRELARIKRERTDMKENEEIDDFRAKPAKKKPRFFMQKHYHKGLFLR